MNSNYIDYFSYLQKRSRLGLYYRQYILYPKLDKCIQGITLDIGCGIGDFIKYRKDQITIGVDVNPETVKWCVSQGLNVKLIEQDQLNFEDNSFDSIILDNVLEHIEFPYPLLHEIKRVLTPNGRLLVGVPGIKGYNSDSDHKVYYDQVKLVETLIKAGFNPEKLFSMPLNLPFLSSILSQYCIYGLFRPS